MAHNSDLKWSCSPESLAMSEAVRWRLRPDLLWETVHFGRRLTHVVKDPVTGRFFHFDPREFAILRLLDGERDAAEVFAAARDARPDESLPTDILLRFLAEARRNGLLLLRGGVQTNSGEPAPPRNWSLLSAKIPLFNPAAWLAILRPYVAGLFSRSFLVIYALIVLSAIGLVLGRFEDFTARLPEAQAWTTPSMVASVMIVLAACKVVHELAHAVVADRFGVRVQECGVMLFYFLPCFYCDVSDAWLLRSARKRVLVSAAGMLAELGLAGVATWLWWFSVPGPVQALCLAVMTACSINTLFINGNPLMRFDGYFILVDLLGIPNLAAGSRQWWGTQWERLVFGLRQPAGTSRDDLLLAVYGAASLVYRVLVLTAVLWGIHAALDARGAGVVSSALILFVGVGMIRSAARSAVRPVLDPLLRRSIQPQRTAGALAVIALLFSLAAVVPLPRSVEIDITVESVDATSVFVQTPGTLRSIKPVGSVLAKGDEIALLEDLATVRRLEELESQRVVTERQLESARVRRTLEPEAGREIPQLVESLAGIDERLSLARRDVADLRVLAPRAGTLLAPPNVPARYAGPKEAAQWSGTPFDPQNIGCTLRPGTLLAVLAPTKDQCAVAYISQRRIERIRTGQRVRLVLDGQADAPLAGVVSDISPAPIEQLPRELAATHRVPLQPASEGRPLEPMYRARILLDPGTSMLIVGSLGTARIKVDSVSALRQVVDLLTETFRFEFY